MLNGKFDMPPVDDAGGYLLKALFEAGPIINTGMITRPLRVVEVAEYGQVMWALSEPWEYRAVADMSAAYLRAKIAGADPFAKSPMEQEAG